MNSPAHPTTGTVIDFGAARALRTTAALPKAPGIHRIVFHYFGEAVHQHDLSGDELLHMLESDRSLRYCLYRSLQQLRPDLGIRDFTGFDYVVQLGAGGGHA